MHYYSFLLDLHLHITRTIKFLLLAQREDTHEEEYLESNHEEHFEEVLKRESTESDAGIDEVTHRRYDTYYVHN